jgi:hypothetical protein
VRPGALLIDLFDNLKHHTPQAIDASLDGSPDARRAAANRPLPFSNLKREIAFEAEII